MVGSDGVRSARGWMPSRIMKKPKHHTHHISRRCAVLMATNPTNLTRVKSSPVQPVLDDCIDDI